jgi:hypothetical protein
VPDAYEAPDDDGWVSWVDLHYSDEMIGVSSAARISMKLVLCRCWPSRHLERLEAQLLASCRLTVGPRFGPFAFLAPPSHLQRRQGVATPGDFGSVSPNMRVRALVRDLELASSTTAFGNGWAPVRVMRGR